MLEPNSWSMAESLTTAFAEMELRSNQLALLRALRLSIRSPSQKRLGHIQAPSHPIHPMVS